MVKDCNDHLWLMNGNLRYRRRDAGDAAPHLVRMADWSVWKKVTETGDRTEVGRRTNVDIPTYTLGKCVTRVNFTLRHQPQW